MSDLSEKERRLAILRYTEIGVPFTYKPMPPEVAEELRKIRDELGMTHEELVDAWASITLPQFGVHPPK
jgi:hypothetical protein